MEATKSMYVNIEELKDDFIICDSLLLNKIIRNSENHRSHS